MLDLFSGVVPFVATAEAKSFGKAAAQLGISTAAVSKAIKRLEEGLGVKLLDRSSRVVSPTREGEVFLTRCRQAVLDVTGAREAIASQRKEPQGELAVTLSTILAPFVVPQLNRLAVQYPRLAFRLQITDRIARLADERYDVAIRLGDLPDSNLVTRRLRTTRWVTVASPSYLARRPAPRAVAELEAHNCLRFLQPDGRIREWAFADKPRVGVNGNFVIDHGGQLLVATAHGMGICQVLDFMVEDALRTGSLIEVLANHACEGPEIHALATPGRARSQGVRAFMQFLAETFR